MSLPYWVLEECKKRKKQKDYSDLPVYEVNIRYIDEVGRLRYDTKRLGPDMQLSYRTLANLVHDIEDRHEKEVRKTPEGWYESDGTMLNFKAEYTEDGKFYRYKADRTPYRSEFKEYDSFQD